MANSSESFTHPIDYLTSLRTTFYAMVGLPLLGFLLVYFASREGAFDGYAPGLFSIFQYVVPLFAAASGISAFVLYNARLKEARQQATLKQKVEAMYQACTLQYALLEGGSVFTLTAYVLTAHGLFAGIYIAMLILFAMNNPTIYTMINHLQLPKGEVQAMKQNQRFEE